jgi:hypothetical protein
MSQIVNFYKYGLKNPVSYNPYQTKIFVELLKNLEHHILYDVGASYGYYSLIGASYGWSVNSFEMNAKNYGILCHNIRENQMENKITPIFTKIGLKPPLDYFINKQNIGLVRINVGGNEVEVIEGLKYSLSNHLIESIIINIYPGMRPTNIWIELITYIEDLGYHIFDLNVPQIDKIEETIKLVPFNMDNIHQITETTLLFLKKNSR